MQRPRPIRLVDEFELRSTQPADIPPVVVRSAEHATQRTRWHLNHFMHGAARQIFCVICFLLGGFILLPLYFWQQRLAKQPTWRYEEGNSTTPSDDRLLSSLEPFQVVAILLILSCLAPLLSRPIALLCAGRRVRVRVRLPSLHSDTGTDAHAHAKPTFVVAACDLMPSHPSHRDTRCIQFEVVARARDIVVHAVSVAGDLGLVHVFVRAEGENGDAAVDGLDWRQWRLIAEAQQTRRWAEHATIPLRVSVRVATGSSRAFCVHAPPPFTSQLVQELTAAGKPPKSDNALATMLEQRKRAALTQAPLLYRPVHTAGCVPCVHAPPPVLTASSSAAYIRAGHVVNGRDVPFFVQHTAEETARQDRHSRRLIDIAHADTYVCAHLVGGVHCTIDDAPSTGALDVSGEAVHASSPAPPDSTCGVGMPPETEATQIVCLENVQPDIGVINRQLIAEWSGRSTMPARRPLLLPSNAGTAINSTTATTTATAAVTTDELLDGPSHVVLDRLWGSRLPTRALWLRFLGTADAWLAQLRAMVVVMRSCRHPPLAMPYVLTPLLHAAPACDGAAAEPALTEAARLLKRALASVGSDGDRLEASAMRLVEEAAACAEERLTRRLSLFRTSLEAACLHRLAPAMPRAVSLADFSLLRRLGKGASGVVFAARKEDTCALFALKAIRPHRRSAKRKSPDRGVAHLLAERAIGELATACGCLNLCGLRYAFVAGENLFMVLPLCTGGTLQVHIDERAIPRHGVPAHEVRWVGAQLTLALSALHSLGYVHRDVKPNNVLVRADGYLVLSDFGLSARCTSTPSSLSATGGMDAHPAAELSEADTDVLRRRVGTRGYWSPETVNHAVQGPPSDWWSLGVLLAFVGTGEHPMHRKWERMAEECSVDTPPAPWEGSAHSVLAPSSSSAAAEEASSRAVVAIGPGASSADAAAALESKAPLSPTLAGSSQASPSVHSLPCHSPSPPPTTSTTRRPSDDGFIGGRGRSSSEDCRRGSRSSRHATRLAEEGLNYNTLYMPHALLLRGLRGEVTGLVSGLLERDTELRLGDAAVMAHPFFADVEWELMRAAELPAPFTPDATLVYAKDYLRPQSEDLAPPGSVAADGARAMARADSRRLLEGWDYVCGESAFGEELEQLVVKHATSEVLSALHPF